MFAAILLICTDYARLAVNKSGGLVFGSQFPATPASYVEMCLNGKLSIGASGGGASTKDLAAAMEGHT
jgi:hypothetical protein